MNRPIYPDELRQHMGHITPPTLLSYIRTGKLPAPCVQITRQQRYWYRDKLAAVGIVLPEVAQVSHWQPSMPATPPNSST